MSTEPKTIGDQSIVDLTKREVFAMHALAGLVAPPDGLYFGTVGRPYDPFPECARQAVAAADALIAELAKGPPR